MAFLSGLTVGDSYLFHTPWGAERVALLSADEESIAARDLDSGVERVYRPEVILGYEPLTAPAPEAVKQPEPEPVPEPSYIFEPDPAPVEPPKSDRRIGVIEAFFASPVRAGGYGYILPESTSRRARRDGVFFHIKQVSEDNLFRLLSSLPVSAPDEGGKRRPARLATPVTVSYLLGDNRARTEDSRPVAYDVRLTDDCRDTLRRLCGHGATRADENGYAFVGSSVGYFSEYKVDSFDQLALRLYVMEEDGDRELTLYGRDIADPYLKRYFEELRPAAPRALAIAIDLFERAAPPGKRGKRKPALFGAHAMPVGATPWSADDEKRWEATLTSVERETYELCRRADFAHDVFAVSLPKDRPIPVEETLSYDDGGALSPVYQPLAPWIG